MTLKVDPTLPAPDFDPQGRPYPSAGAKIGPAWAAAWAALADGSSATPDFLMGLMCQTTDIRESTARDLLRQALRAGHLIAERGARNKIVFYTRAR